MRAIKIETERLVIYPKSIEEMEAAREKEEDPEMKQVYKELLELMYKLPGQEEWGSDWSICLKEGLYIGGICFKGTPDETGSVEIGYGIDEAYQGKGYATEAVGGITKWALEQEKIVWVTAQTEPGNTISQKVLLKNGYVRDGEGNEGPMFKIKK